MDTFHAIRVKALACVREVDVDASYFERKLWRWYSHTFSTPLAEVLDIPIEDVLQHYWEWTYEHMDPSLQDHEAETLSMSEAEAKALADAKEQEEREIEEDVKAMEALELERRQKQEKAKLPVKDAPLTPKDLPSDFKFEFVTEEELEAEAAKLAESLIPPKRRI